MSRRNEAPVSKAGRQIVKNGGRFLGRIGNHKVEAYVEYFYQDAEAAGYQDHLAPADEKSLAIEVRVDSEGRERQIIVGRRFAEELLDKLSGKVPAEGES